MWSQFMNLFKFDSWNDLFNNYIFTTSFLINILDILVVWYLIYKLFSLVKGTKAVQLLKGIAVIIVVRIVSALLGLMTVSWLMDQVITYGVIAAIIIFQPEVRRGLEHLGRGALFRKTSKSERKDLAMVNAFDKAIQYMAKRKIGALITIQKTTGLEEYIETGIPINAEITGELLINIFIPNTPLHDGAVIIRDDKIAAASAYLPLSENESIPKEFGTRHRAAVGISEVSDSLTIIVSEETGDVSIAQNNYLDTHLTQEQYLKVLKRELVKEKNEEKENLFQTFLDGISKGGGK
ncbi:diadenylate cyclase CdaA [uncultured Vagococcus sp.]|uniref:diadenylate cyclase CdaA n=1 Tax=uncultured Vagococcus sp. TaxID=189676 RepID=UPI0028D620AB|nr:diadenylate cyclase CdaA [uncultured Vagococcus sp.]